MDIELLVNAVDIAANAIDFKTYIDLPICISIVEDRIEGYRFAYLELTGIDLALSIFRSKQLKIEQQIQDLNMV
jgi:hypothetical protein